MYVYIFVTQQYKAFLFACPDRNLIFVQQGERQVTPIYHCHRIAAAQCRPGTHTQTKRIPPLPPSSLYLCESKSVGKSLS